MQESSEAVDEAELVRRTAAGDRQAFDELYRRTSPWLALRLQRRCADEDVVVEVLQETYLAVWRAAGSFAGAATSGSAVGWIWTIAADRSARAAHPGPGRVGRRDRRRRVRAARGRPLRRGPPRGGV